MQSTGDYLDALAKLLRGRESLELWPQRKYVWMVWGFFLFFSTLFLFSAWSLTISRDGHELRQGILAVSIWGAMTSLCVFGLYHFPRHLTVTTEGMVVEAERTPKVIRWHDIVSIERSDFRDSTSTFVSRSGDRYRLELQFFDKTDLDVQGLKHIFALIAKRHLPTSFCGGPSPYVARVLLAIGFGCLGLGAYGIWSLFTARSMGLLAQMSSSLVLIGPVLILICFLFEHVNVAPSGITRHRSLGGVLTIAFEEIQRLELHIQTYRSSDSETMTVFASQGKIGLSSNMRDYGGMRDFILERVPADIVHDNRRR